MTRRTSAAFALTPEVLGGVFPPDVLAQLGRSVAVAAGPPLDDFASPRARRVLADTEILITGWGCPPIDSRVLAMAPRLRAIIHAAGSVKHHVGAEVFERGIAVSSAADANARPVAEYTLAICVLAAKRAFALARAYSAGESVHGVLITRPAGLAGATVGVVGASRIGRLVIGMLAGHDTRVLVHDPYLDAAAARALGAEPVDLDRLCAESDIVTVHAPETPETRHLIDSRRLSLMADGAVLINTSRGSLVDTDALLEQCRAGRIDAILDVTDPEPLPAGHALLTLPNVLVTPHLAGAQGRELRRLGEYAVAEVERFMAGQPLCGLVAAAHLSRIA